jgi:predicted transcriptional regulator
MSDTIDKVLERVKSWPEERQADAVRVLEAMEHAGTTALKLTDEERTAVQIGLDQANRGEFATEKEMEAFWHRNRT